jgi:hypothetical protein
MRKCAPATGHSLLFTNAQNRHIPVVVNPIGELLRPQRGIVILSAAKDLNRKNIAN